RATAAVIAGRALWLHRVGAHAGRTVALANVVALIEHRADHRVPAGTLTRLAAVGSGAEAPIAAGRAVVLRRVGADSCGRVALAHRVALIESRADDRVRPDALACRAPVGLGTGIAIIAGRPVVLGEVDAGTSGRTGLPRAGGLGAATLSLQGESAVDAARVARLVTLLAARGLDAAIAT